PRFFFSSRRRHTRFSRDWSSDVCSSDLGSVAGDLPGGIPLNELAILPQPVVAVADGEPAIGRCLEDHQVAVLADGYSAGVYHLDGEGFVGRVLDVEIEPVAVAHGVGKEIGRAACRARAE